MADLNGAVDQKHPSLHLSPEEKRYFGQLFSQADTENIGVVTGEVAVRFFEKTRLSSSVLGEIWQIADSENRGLLTPAGFGVVLRLIGYAQAGRDVSMELALKPGGPLPRFDGIPGPANAPPNVPAPLQAQPSGGPIRVPPLSPDKINQYTALFEESGAQNGLLSGEAAKQIFERANLPNEVLGRIWNLSDIEQRGALGVTEFIIAMHLLASYKMGALRALPQILPPGLHEAAARRGPPPRQPGGSRPSGEFSIGSAIPRQFSGAGPQRTASPASRAPYGQPQSPSQASFTTPSLSAQSTGTDWAIGPQDKAQFDNIYSSVDKDNRGIITGEQAVGFFSNSRLPEDVLAQIWDLADINSEGHLTRDEFAVAMFLIRQQRSKKDPRDTLPQSLPHNLIPPSMRRQPIAPQQPTAPAFDNAANITSPKSAAEDLFGLDAFSSQAPQAPQSTGDSSFSSPISQAPQSTGSPAGVRSASTPGQGSSQQPQISQQQPSAIFKPFVPSSSFGQSIMTPQGTGTSGNASPSQTGSLVPQRSQQQQQRQPPAEDDLLGDNDPEVSSRLTQETTELANLSNQVGNLTTQMQDVKSKRSTTDQDLSQVNTQKREFENRLSQLRGMYEKEVREVKALDGRLLESRNETKKLQQDIALLNGTYQDLQNQHQQLFAAFEADQKENASLKERIRQLNVEINEIKPRIEKVRSEARQQKGLVAINKKQLVTNEQERDKAKVSLDEASTELEEVNKEVQDTSKQLELGKRSLPPQTKPATSTGITSPAAVASPTGQSMNPFFRRAPSTITERDMSPTQLSAPSVASPNHNAFDSFFGPSLTSNLPSGTPATSFGKEQSQNTRGLAPDLEQQKFSTPSESPPLEASPGQSLSSELPAPPQSRQITSSFLPFNLDLPRSDSLSSSVKVSAPASRIGESSDLDNSREVSGTDTFIRDRATPQQLERMNTSTTTIGAPASQQNISSLDQGNEHQLTGKDTSPHSDSEDYHSFGEGSGSSNMPGGFPGEDTAADTHPVRSEPSVPGANKSMPNVPLSAVQKNEVSPNRDHSRSPMASKDDFDSAFAGFADERGAATHDTTKPSPILSRGISEPKNISEFPPLQEFGAEDDSDTESDHGPGFDDNFDGALQSNNHSNVGTSQIQPNSGPIQPVIPPRPEAATGASTGSQLPTPGAENSSPTYEPTLSAPSENGQPRGHKDSNPFPAAYSGLLPSREDPMPSAPSSAVQESAVASPVNSGKPPRFDEFSPKEHVLSGHTLPASQMPMSPGTSAAPFAYSQPAQVESSKSSNPSKDEFEDEFGDLDEAQEGEDDFGTSQKDVYDEFNPNFDPPAASKLSTSQSDTYAGYPSNGTQKVESNTSSGIKPPNTRLESPAPKSSAPASNDWDAIFAGLDSNPAPFNQHPTLPPRQNTLSSQPALPPRAQGGGAVVPAGLSTSKPPLARALTSGTEHDDPILKRLTGMGYSREASLEALEKYDYNLEMAANYLASKT